MKKAKIKNLSQPINKKSNIQLLLIFLIFLITLIAFSPSIINGFVRWDDYEILVENNLVKDFSYKGIINIFSSFVLNTYVPFTLLTFMIEYYFFQLNPIIYHTTNIILHSIDAVLLFLLIYKLCGNIYTALLTSLLWALHPQRVESVAWVTERKDVLYTLFFFSSFIAYLNYAKFNNRKYYFLSIALFVLSILSKGMAIILPFLLILTDFYLKRNVKVQKNIIEKLPFFIFAIISSVISFVAQKTFGNVAQAPSFSLVQRFFIASYVGVFYIYKLFLPINLSCIYPYPSYPHRLNPHLTLPDIYYIAPIILLVFIIILFVSLRKTRKVFWSGFFFLISIFPIMQFLPVAGHAMAYDRYSLIASIGLIYLVSEGILYIKKYKSKYQDIIRVFIIIGIPILIGSLSFMSYKRCFVWRNSLTLFGDAVKKTPNAPAAHYNLAMEYRSRGDFQKAFYYFTKAIEVDPEYSDAFNGRGITYIILNNDYEKAIDDFNQSVRFNPNNSGAYYNRAIAYERTGDLSKTFEDLNIVIKLNPKDKEALFKRASIFVSQGNNDKAIDDLNRLINVYPDLAEVYYKRSQIYLSQKKYDLALQDIEKAKSLGFNVSQELIENVARLRNEKLSY